MTDFLVKKFIKNYEDYEKQSVRTSYGVLASIVGVICNVILFGVKLIIGILINSISVMADAFNNLSDAASSIISFVGVKLANRPADKEHPFGHGRYEYIAALVVAFLVLQVGFTCFKSSLTKVFHPEELKFQPVLILILAISVFIKIWLGFFNKNLGKKVNSSVMKATAADAFGDVLITSGTIVSILISKLLGFNIDGYAGVLVSIVVLLAGFNIAKDTLEPLIGQAVDHELYTKITQKVENYAEIVGSHDLIVHNYGPSNTMATIHAEVPNDIDIEIAHDTIDCIERDVLRELNVFLVIHMDPIEVNNKVVSGCKNKVIEIIRGIDERASIHDFRMVRGETHTNLIFDLVVPYTYTEKQEESLLFIVIERISEYDQQYKCVIHLEHSYIADKKED